MNPQKDTTTEEKQETDLRGYEKAGSILRHVVGGAVVGWLISSFFILESGPNGGERGLLHMPTKFDLGLVAVCAIVGGVYAAIQVARGRDP